MPRELPVTRTTLPVKSRSDISRQNRQNELNHWQSNSGHCVHSVEILAFFAPMASPIRILTAVPICDGHDSAINTINLEFIRHGIEVVYLGYHRSVSDIVRAAIQEDVRAIGISSYNGGHVEFFAEVVNLLRKHGADEIKVFGGGGGTITDADATAMRRKGVDKIFFAGTSLSEMVQFVRSNYGKPRKKRRRAKNPDIALARKLTEIEDRYV